MRIILTYKEGNKKKGMNLKEKIECKRNEEKERVGVWNKIEK